MGVERLKNGEVVEAGAKVADGSGAEEESSSEEEEEVPPAEKVRLTEAESDSEGSEDEDEDDEEAGRKELKKKETEDEEAARLAKALMSKKASRLYGRMQHGIAQKQDRVDNLHKKRREIESTREKTKDGKSMLKLKVERLKSERREKEDAYKNTGGSMKKKRRKN